MRDGVPPLHHSSARRCAVVRGLRRPSAAGRGGALVRDDPACRGCRRGAGRCGGGDAMNCATSSSTRRGETTRTGVRACVGRDDPRGGVRRLSVTRSGWARLHTVTLSRPAAGRVTATRLPARRVVGCGGVALGCTPWPAFVWRWGRHCLSVPKPGRVRRWSPAPIQFPLIDRGPSVGRVNYVSSL